MSEIILYAAAAEAGARAALAWIQRSSARLLEEHGIVVVRARLTDPDATAVDIVPLHGGAVDSSELGAVTAQLRAAGDPRFGEITEHLSASLATAAARYGRVLLAGDGFAHLVGGRDPAFLQVVFRLPSRRAIRPLRCPISRRTRGPIRPEHRSGGPVPPA